MAIVNSVPHVLSGCKEGQTGGGIYSLMNRSVSVMAEVKEGGSGWFL